MRVFFLTVFALSSLALFTALAVEHWGGIVPCGLCIDMRWLYVALAAVSLAGCYLHPYRLFWALFGLVVLVGIILAAYHLGIEQHWWKGPEKCFGIARADSLEALRQQIQRPVPRCDEVSWRILGLSATFWNLLYLVGLFFVGMIVGKQNCPHHKS